jgi:4-aminobutyrate aminotransferase
VLVDVDGREYLDFTAGIGVTSTEHCHPKVVAAAQEQVGRLIHGQYTRVMHQPLQRLVARLGEVLPAGLDSVFFVNAGSEAVEAALRLARQATGRPNVIAFHGGFPGRTIGAASLTTSGIKFRTGFAPLMGGVSSRPSPQRSASGRRSKTPPTSPCGNSTTCCRPSRRPATRQPSSSSRSSAKAATSRRPPGSYAG